MCIIYYVFVVQFLTLSLFVKVVQACSTFTGDLKGTFYPLEGMDEKTQKQLIADHFLFKLVSLHIFSPRLHISFQNSLVLNLGVTLHVVNETEDHYLAF